jgi:hypothetical protein
MIEKKVKLEIELPVRDAAILDNHGVIEEVISKLVREHLEIPDHLKTMEEKRKIAPYKMYFKDRNLLLEVHYEGDIVGFIEDRHGNVTGFSTEPTKLKGYLKREVDEEGNFYMAYLDDDEEEIDCAKEVFKYFKKEIDHFNETLKFNQRVENGVLIEEEVKEN